MNESRTDDLRLYCFTLVESGLRTDDGWGLVHNIMHQLYYRRHTDRDPRKKAEETTDGLS